MLIGGHRYAFVLVYDNMKHIWTFFMKSKDETLRKFKVFVSTIEKLTGLRLKIFRSDRGGEFMSDAFTEFLEENGITRQTSAPWTPQQNGTAERMNQTLIGGARAMLQHAGLSKGFWAEAMATTTHILNRSPRKGLDWKTPHELLFGQVLDISYLRVFGCCACVIGHYFCTYFLSIFDPTSLHIPYPTPFSLMLISTMLVSSMLYMPSRSRTNDKNTIQLVQPDTELFDYWATDILKQSCCGSPSPGSCAGTSSAATEHSHHSKFRTS